MPLVTDKTQNNYANQYRNQEIIDAVTRLDEPEISPLTQTYLDPNVIHDNDVFNVHLYQNATIYVSYECNGKYYLLVTVNKARGLKDEAANLAAMTPGGRRERDHGLVYTAFKEMEEETNLKLDALCNMFPSAEIRYLKTAQIDTKRGYLNFKAQLHCYSIELGKINLQEAKSLENAVKPGDDVEYAEFVDVTKIVTQQAFQVKLSSMQNLITLLPAVRQLTIEIFTEQLPNQASEPYPLSELVFLLSEPAQNVTPVSNLATSSSSSSIATTSSAVAGPGTDQPSQLNRAEYLLDKIIDAQNSHRHNQITRLLKTLLLVTSLITLKKVVEKKNEKAQRTNLLRAELAENIMLNYCQLKLNDITQVNNKHLPQSEESRETQRKVSNFLINDDERFQIAQAYMFAKPDKRYARALRSQIIGKITIENITLRLSTAQIKR